MGIGHLHSTHCLNFQSATEFDGNIDEIFNAIIEDTLADYLTRFNGVIVNTFAADFVETLNSVLGLYETWRLIAAIIYD